MGRAALAFFLVPIVASFATDMVLVFPSGMLTLLPRTTLRLIKLGLRGIGVLVRNAARAFFLVAVVTGVPADMVLIFPGGMLALLPRTTLRLIKLLGGSLSKRKRGTGQKRCRSDKNFIHHPTPYELQL